MNASMRFASRHERKFIFLLCAVAAVRVLTFAAAFPFFNNVDEQAHVDLVMKYARGDVPRDLGHFSSESAYYLSTSQLRSGSIPESCLRQSGPCLRINATT